MAKEKKVIDWDLVEKDWRAGLKTKQQMAVEHGVSRAAMDKRFAKLNISRHLGVKIRAKAASLVEQSVVPATAEPLSPAREREIVEVNATMQSQIILSHRSDIQRTRRLSMRLLGELETIHQRDELEGTGLRQARRRLQAGTAGTADVGRGNTAQVAHLSEFAFWKNAQMHMAEPGNTIADLDDTEIIIESTVNGTGGGFHSMWQDAEAGIG